MLGSLVKRLGVLALVVIVVISLTATVALGAALIVYLLSLVAR